MRCSPVATAVAVLLPAFAVAAPPSAGPSPATGFGRTPTPAEIAAEDIDVRADGAGLPPGRGTVAQGAEIFASQCAACHGAQGVKPVVAALRLVGGRGTLATPAPVRTVGSYWPYATTLFDYIRRAMPFTAPQSLAPDQVYAVTAYVLRLNGIVADDAVLDAQSLPKIRMPNRDGFLPVYKPPR